LVMTRDRRPD